MLSGIQIRKLSPFHKNAPRRVTFLHFTAYTGQMSSEHRQIGSQNVRLGERIYAGMNRTRNKNKKNNRV